MRSHTNQTTIFIVYLNSSKDTFALEITEIDFPKRKIFTFGLPIPSRYHDYGIARTALPRYTWLHLAGK